MIRMIAMLVLFGLSSSAAAVPLPCGSGAGAATVDASDTALEVKTSATTVSVVLTNPPSTRVRVSLDEISGKHVDLEWDPALDRTLARTATLSPGIWEVTTQADSSLVPRNGGSSLLVVKFDAPKTDAAGKIHEIQGSYMEVSSASAALAKGVPLHLPGPRLKIRCDAPKPSMDQVAFARPTTAVPGQRGVTDGLREPVAEVLSLLGEIAIDRAKAAAMGLLQRRIVEPLCGLTKEDSDTTKGGVLLKDLRLGGKEIALPRTCELLRRLRLGDVLAAGKPLLRVLRDDLRLTIAPAGIRAAAGGSAWSVIARNALAVANRVIDQRTLSVLDAQIALDLFRDLAPFLSIARVTVIADTNLEGQIKTALDQLALPARTKLCPNTSSDSQACAAELLAKIHSGLELDQLAIRIGANRKQLLDRFLTWASTQVRDTKDPKLVRAVSFACHARLAVTVVRACSDGSCTPQTIVDRLTNPHDYFEPDQQGPAQMCWDSNEKHISLPDANLAAFRDLVIVGLELIDTARGPQGQGRAVALLRLLVAFGREAAGCGPTMAGKAHKACDRLDAVGELLIALAEEDHTRALTSATMLVQHVLGGRKLPKQLAKASQLVGAVAAYAKVYDETKEDDPKAAREARKQALESMIDAATDRRSRSRDDNEVWSIGSNLGLSSTWTWERENARDFVDDAEWAPQLRVPLSISWQKLPPSYKEDSPIGLHFSFVLADLGQFAAVGDEGLVDDVRWNNFLSPGLELGLLLGSRPETKFNISAHVAYAPTLFQSETPKYAGAIRFGVNFSYYVPFLDFN